MKNPPEEPDNDNIEKSDAYTIRLSDKAAKSIKLLRVSQKHSHEKVWNVINALAEWDGSPPNIDITKMKGQIHGRDVYAATVKGKPEYRVLYQDYNDHIMVEDVMTTQLFLSRYKRGIG